MKMDIYLGATFRAIGFCFVALFFKTLYDFCMHYGIYTTLVKVAHRTLVFFRDIVFSIHLACVDFQIFFIFYDRVLWIIRIFLK